MTGFCLCWTGSFITSCHPWQRDTSKQRCERIKVWKNKWRTFRKTEAPTKLRKFTALWEQLAAARVEGGCVNQVKMSGGCLTHKYIRGRQMAPNQWQIRLHHQFDINVLNTWCGHGVFASWFVSRTLLRSSSTTAFSASGEAVFSPRSRAVHVCLIVLPNPLFLAQLHSSYMSGAGSTHSPIQSPPEQQMKDFFWLQWTWNQVLSRASCFASAPFVVSPNCWLSMWRQPNNL